MTNGFFVLLVASDLGFVLKERCRGMSGLPIERDRERKRVRASKRARESWHTRFPDCSASEDSRPGARQRYRAATLQPCIQMGPISSALERNGSALVTQRFSPGYKSGVSQSISRLSGTPPVNQGRIFLKLDSTCTTRKGLAAGRTLPVISC